MSELTIEFTLADAFCEILENAGIEHSATYLYSLVKVEIHQDNIDEAEELLREFLND